MGFTNEIYSEALSRLSERKKRAESEARERYRAFCEVCPEYRETENRLSRTGSLLMKTIFDPNSNVQACVEKIKNENTASQKKMKSLLSEHGLSADYLEPNYSCKKCEDTGFIDGARCECLECAMKKLAFERLNASTPLELSTFDSFSLENYPDEPVGGISPRRLMERTFARCKSYAENFSPTSPSILLQGGVGLGKTHLSLAIAGKVIEKGYDVIYGSAQNFFNKIENERFGRAPAGNDTLSLILSADLLVLDDLGAEFTTQFTSSVLYDILNTRLLASKPTIISTNLNMEGIEQRYSERILSRIQGSYNRLQFVGKDMRFTLRKIKTDKQGG